ncbi:MAG: TonB-dependent receptor [Gammaproteobacteria bacterium]|nr:TonB-dependent receptor [Gammaproteobacteria bacterium]
MLNSYFKSAMSAVITVSLISLAYADDDPMVIVVTPSAIEQSRNQAITTLTVIEQSTIEQSSATSVAELIRGQAGLHVSDFFGDGSQATVDLRGFGPTATNNTLILLDGMPLNNSTDTAAPDLSIIDIDDIAQIEILQGSGGVLYGNQAVGGVVNIIRRKVTEDKASVSLSTGSFGASRLNAAFRKSLGRTKISATLSDRQTDNYRDNNEADNQRLSARVEHRHASFDSYIELEKIEDEIETPGALLGDELDEDRKQSLSFYEDDFFATDSDILRFGVSKNLDEARSFKIDYSNRITEREFIQTFRPFPGSLTTQDRDSSILSAKYIVNPVVPESYSSLLFGAYIDRTDYELVSLFGPQDIDQTIRDIYFSSEWPVGDAGQLSAGVRASDQQAEIAGEDFDDTVTVLSLGYSWRQNGLKVFLRGDQNYRFPTVEEHTNVPFGEEPGLLTQEGLSLELGAEWQEHRNRYRATIYSIDLENEIAFDSTGFANLNLDETSREGVILEAFRRWSDALTFGVSVTLLDAEIADGSFKGNKLPLVPEQTIRLDTMYQFSPELLLGIEVIAVDEQVLGGDFDNQLSKLASHEVVNVHVSYNYRDWEFAFRVNNLLDEEYSETGSQFTEYDPITFAATDFEAFFPAPERNFVLSAKVSF